MNDLPLRFGMPFLLETPDLGAALALCSKLKLDFIELNQNFPECLTENLAPAELREAAVHEGIFFTYHLDDALNFCDFKPKVREAYVQTALDTINWAAEAGVETINLHLPRGGVVTLPDGPHYLYSYHQKAFMENVRSFRDRCSEAAQGRSIRLAIENTEGWADYELEAVAELLRSPVFGLTLDIGHDDATGGRDLRWIESRKDRLIHMHAHDGVGQTNHRAFGSGDIPLQDRLNLAAEVNATIVIETKTAAALEESVEWLRKHRG